MSFLHWLIGGIFGLTGLSSMTAFVVHLIHGNPTLALQCFLGLGGSVAAGWMVLCYRQSTMVRT